MMNSDYDYEQSTSIDPDALDVEWLRQADLMRHYASGAAEAKRSMDEAKERQDIIAAQVEMAIRKAPEDYGMEKLTESIVKSLVLLQPQYQETSSEYIAAKYEFEMANAAVRAIDQKKSALENLVRLFSASYFAGPVSPRNLSEEWGKENERKGNNMKVKIQQRKAQE